jgi:hypothetical protein
MLPDSVSDGIGMFSIYSIPTQADSEHLDYCREGMKAAFIQKRYPISWRLP